MLDYKSGHCPSCKHPQHVGRICNHVNPPGPVGTYQSPPCMCPPEAAIKETNGKQRGFYLLPWDSIGDVAEICLYGIEKGDLEDSWKNVNPREYFDAFMRHAGAIARGEIIDKPSGKRHAAMMAWNALVYNAVTRHIVEAPKLMPPERVEGEP